MAHNEALHAVRSYYEQLYTRRRQRRPEEIKDFYDNPIGQHYQQALRQWVSEHHLQHGRVLEIGSGSGMFQDLVDDYVAIDIAASSGAYIRKSFSAASASALPFASASFDGVWSVWVLEHVPEPEAMLAEIVRVLKPGGVLFLVAAWDVAPWVAQGYDVRPFASLSWRERLIKLTVMPRAALPYRRVSVLLRRAWRLARVRQQETPPALDYQQLTPNFETYWSSDADACTSVDSHAVWLWLTRRGHESLDTRSGLGSLFLRHVEPLRFRKART